MLEQSLFTSCYAAKKRTSERSEQVTFLMHRNSWIKIVEALPWYDVFISYIPRFPLSNRHVSRIRSKRLWKYIVRPIRDTKNSTSWCKSQYVWNKTLCCTDFYERYIIFSIFYGTGVSCIFLLLSGKLARNRLKLASVCACATFDPFSQLRIVRRFSPVLSRSILIVQRDRDETDDCEET